MNLSELTSKPELVKLSIDDEATVAEFGEAITFWTYDRQPLDVYLNLSNAMGKDQEKVISILKGLILTEKGEPVIQGDKLPPVKLMVKVMASVMEHLGK